MKIIGLSGKKQSGKDTVCNYVKNSLIYGRKNISYKNKKMTYSDRSNVSKIYHFNNVINYSFADKLKELCINFLGLKREQCYGTNEEKDSKTKYKWENFPEEIRKKYGYPSGYLSGRNVMQVFGTDICRNMFYRDIWIDQTIKKIDEEKSKIAFISDIRFESEVVGLKEHYKDDVVFIRLLRNSCVDIHESETGLDDFDFSKFNSLIIGKDVTIDEQNDIVCDFLNKNGIMIL